MRGDLRGHAQPARLGVGHRRQRRLGREVAAVQRRARLLGQRDVPLHHHGFGRRRLPAQPQPRRNDPVVHDAAGRDGRVLAVLRQRDVEIGQVLEGPPRDGRVGHRVAVVRNGHRARIAQARELGQVAAGAADRDAGDRQHPRVGSGRRVEHAGDQHRRINRRRRVGHRADRREAAARRGPRAGRDRLLVLLAGLAQVHVQVDEAGSDDESRRVQHGRAVGRFQAGPGFGDAPVAEQQVERRVDAVAGVDQAAAADQDRCRHSPPLASRKRTAMRIASPAETCASIRLCAPCATSGAISTPSFIGPGCITTACGAAAATRSAVSW